MNVLVVDDDFDIRLTLKELLEDEGYSVTTAANGAEALDMLFAQQVPPPKLILLDLMMPIMDGLEFRERQLEDDELSAIPTIVLTAQARAREKVAPLSVRQCLQKPVQLDDLLKVVHHYCRS